MGTHHDNQTPSTRRRRATFTAALAAAIGAITLGFGAAPATADSPCQDRTTSASFSFLGDSNQYFTAPNGSFDSNAEWVHYGSRFVDGTGSPVNVARGSLVRSGYLGGSSTMLSTWTCVRGNEDTVRFAIKPVGSSPGELRLRLFVSDPSSSTGWSVKTVMFNPAAPGTHVGSGWYVTPRIAIPWTPYWDDTQWISFNFTSAAASGGWLIDDVMIDPWRSN